MVQGAKHMKSNNAAANGGSSPQPKPQPKSKRRRKRLPRWADRLITIVIILIGVGLMTWPWILDRLEASGVFNQISTVSSTVDALSAEERERILLQARSFNEQLAGEATELPADQIEPYGQQLIFDRDPMMSWVEIPSIDVSMPIYHGTSEEVLMAGVGHLEGTSLPVGGTSTHCVRTKYNKKDVDKQKSLAGRHWGKREFAVLIVVVAIVLLLLDIVVHAVRKRRKAKASA